MNEERRERMRTAATGNQEAISVARQQYEETAVKETEEPCIVKITSCYLYLNV